MLIQPFETTINLESNLINPTQFDLLKIMQKGLQDSSTYHADVIGYGAKELDPLNVFWAVARLRVRIIIPLKNHHKYRILTWPNPYDIAGIDRNYQVFDENNECVIEGMGKWVIVDKTKFALIKPKEFILTKDQVNTCVDKVFIDGYLRFNKTVEILQAKVQRVVKSAEIDQNNHVNNVVYLDYIANAVEVAMNQTIQITEYQINYSESLFLNEHFTMEVTEDNNTLYITSYRDNDHKFVFQSIIKKI
jgi:acyl-ACP thioesterase